MSESFDCIVLGGGPAGSTAAALVAEAGFRTLLLERDKFPRFHVGESLMPECHQVLARLGLLEAMRRSRFLRGHSLKVVDYQGRPLSAFCFLDLDPREPALAWHVVRSEFDQMLFENAARLGAVCRDQTRALEVLWEGCRAVGVRAQTSDGSQREFSSRTIIDATGQQSLIARTLQLREEQTRLRKACIWSYYRGATLADDDAGCSLVFRTRTRQSWFWVTPLPDDVVSVGLVADAERLLPDGARPETIFEEELCDCPGVLQRLMNAHMTDDFRVARDFSHAARRSAGEGWVLAGDAQGFLDPIFSSGVFLALKSGELAADSVVEGLRSGDLSASQLGCREPEFRRGVERLRRLIESFYDPDFDCCAFFNAYPQRRRELTSLLFGRVFRADADPFFADVETWLAQRRPDGHSASRPG